MFPSDYRFRPFLATDLPDVLHAQAGTAKRVRDGEARFPRNKDCSRHGVLQFAAIASMRTACPRLAELFVLETRRMSSCRPGSSSASSMHVRG